MKPENILFDGQRWVLTDFGSGRYIGRGVGMPITEMSPMYMAPESLRGSPRMRRINTRSVSWASNRSAG